ncbi:hypothetical protein B0I35DRAFT_196019 [Stachybotrys elegans]|uniref:Uncharacterized protein n=1 Tax=Stachybotrys elegans TaxID=80388 RepID=A0A8K0WJ32_9HYPO|nr:hypothetical protein B0I35DRAFT_196019 [Stachybotrys elegans]
MKKIRVKDVSDEGILERCRKEVQVDDLAIEWNLHNDLEVTNPTESIVAIVVDLTSIDSASDTQLRVYDGKDNPVDMVGKRYMNRVVMVIWERDRKYVCYGKCRVGQIRKDQGPAST